MRAYSSNFEIIWVSLALFLTLPLALLWVCLALFWVILALLWHFFGWRNDPFWSWRSISFSMGLPRMACAFVSTLSVPEGKQFLWFSIKLRTTRSREQRDLGRANQFPSFLVSRLVFTVASLSYLQRNTVDPRAMQAYTLSTLSKDGYRKDTDT